MPADWESRERLGDESLMDAERERESGKEQSFVPNSNGSSLMLMGHASWNYLSEWSDGFALMGPPLISTGVGGFSGLTGPRKQTIEGLGREQRG